MDALDLAGLSGEVAGPVQPVLGDSLAAPHRHGAGHDESGYAGDRRYVRVPDDGVRQPRRRGIAALFEHRRGEPRRHVRLPRAEVVVGAVRAAGAEVLVGVRQQPVADLADPEVRVGARDVLVQVVSDGDVQTLVEPGHALERFLPEEQCSADVIEGVGLDVAVADGPGERDRTIAQLERLRYPSGQHGQLGLVADRHRQLVSGRQRFEGGDG